MSNDAMRQYKFRAWTGKQMDYDYHDACLWNGILVAEGDTVLMQFTGLSDEQGKDIYEGDIVCVEGFYDKQYAQVLWKKVNPFYTWAQGETWILRFKSGAEGPLYPYCQYRNGYTISVIGNIYESEFHP